MEAFDANNEQNDYEVGSVLLAFSPRAAGRGFSSPHITSRNFNADTRRRQIPWALRDLIADERVAHFFTSHFSDLRDAFPHWHPRTAILRDIKRKLQPIQRLASIADQAFPSTSKL